MNEENLSSESVDDKDKSDSMIKLSALELNNIKLDAKHTLLTPDYLERLSSTDEKNLN